METIVGTSNLAKHTSYLSLYAIGEDVTLDFIEAKIEGCKIDAVRFTEDKIRYDVLIPLSFKNQEKAGWTKVENVDSVFVQSSKD